MRNEWSEDTELLAAGSSCPMPDCGELSLAYRPAEGASRNTQEGWEFTCPRCGVEFVVPEEELLFRSVRSEWLWAGIQSA